MPDIIIPGLPKEISVVPPSPTDWQSEDAGDVRIAWRRWRYAVQQYRTDTIMNLKVDPNLYSFEIAKCAAHPAYFSSVMLRVFEPRWRVDASIPIPIGDDDDPDAEIEGVKRIVIPSIPLITQQNLRQVNRHADDYDPALEPIFGYVPFIPFADQVRVMNELLWSLYQTDEHADVLWSKSRGWGASWILCLLGLWGWLFSHHWPGAPPWNILYLSRKEEYVDSKQQKSLFWKIRRLMRDVPPQLMPRGFEPDIHDQKGIIINPENGNELGGESTTSKAGRGDRVTAAILDEAAAMPSMNNIWSTLGETTDHRWACSTESFEEGSDFYDLRIGNEMDVKPYLVETEWWQNPLNDEVWLERQRKRYASNPEAFNQEIWRNPYTGTSQVYPWAHDHHADRQYEPVSGYQSFLSVDPGYRDPTAIIAVQETPRNEFVVLDAYQQAEQPADFFIPLLKPHLFEVSDPDWKDRDYLEWTSPLDDTLTFVYKTRELTFARTVSAISTKSTPPTIIGDTYGRVVTGVSADSVYTRWAKAGIVVVKDRKEGDAVTNSIRQQRTFKGRQEAMNQLSRRWRFADTDGARMCLKAWQNSRFKQRPDKAIQSEPMEPEHGSDSHLRTAGEFLASHIKHRTALAGRALSKPTRGTMQPMKRIPAQLKGAAD